MEAHAELLNRIHKVAEVFTSRHFVYTGGFHGDGYVNYRPLGSEGHELLLREVVLELLKKALRGADVAKYRNILVVGPETMGAKMVGQIAALTESELPYSVDTRRFLKDPANPGQFVWDADPATILDENTLVIWMDDLLNEGSTYRKTAPMIHHYGADVYALATIGDRSGLSAEDFEVYRLVSLEKFKLTRHPEDDCPLCRDSAPIVNDLGHGRKFEEAHADYAGGFVPAR